MQTRCLPAVQSHVSAAAPGRGAGRCDAQTGAYCRDRSRSGKWTSPFPHPWSKSRDIGEVDFGFCHTNADLLLTRGVVMASTRGFTGRRRPPREGLPPGQYDTGSGWPVLTAEVTPRIEPESWSMSVDGLVEHPMTWSWDEMHQLASSEYRGPIHCVTTWSKFDTIFAGVSVDVLLDAAAPLAGATHVLVPRRPATPPIFRSNTSATARRGWSGASTGSRCRGSTGGLSDYWYPTCTSGKARSGSQS